MLNRKGHHLSFRNDLITLNCGCLFFSNDKLDVVCCKMAGLNELMADIAFID